MLSPEPIFQYQLKNPKETVFGAILSTEMSWPPVCPRDTLRKSDYINSTVTGITMYTVT
jgi:hypothetical protein